LGFVGCGLLLQAFLPPATNPTKRLVAAIRVCAVVGLIGIIGYKFPIKATPIPAVIPKTEPQSPSLAPTATPSEPIPPFHEKVEPIPSAKPIPPKVTPPIIKKDIQAKPKEIIPDKPKETIPIPPRETIAAVLIRKYTVLPPETVAAPDRFIPTWIQRINIVRIDRKKRNLRPDLQRLIREIGGPPRQGLTVKEFVDDAVAEAKFTLGCLASEGYIQITETTVEGMWYAVHFDNLEFEFVPEKLNEFIEGL
jgi:hypothetical protein